MIKKKLLRKVQLSLSFLQDKIKEKTNNCKSTVIHFR